MAGIPVVARSFDDGLYRLDLPQAIELFPLGVLKDAVLPVPNATVDRLLDGLRRKRFRGTRRPAVPLCVQTQVTARSTKSARFPMAAKPANSITR